MIQREARCGIKIDPAKAGEIDLDPAMGLIAIDNPGFLLRIVVSLAKAIDHAGWYPKQAGHNRHRGRVIGTVASMRMQQPGHGISICGNRWVRH